jgi:hypothetical protein
LVLIAFSRRVFTYVPASPGDCPANGIFSKVSIVRGNKFAKPIEWFGGSGARSPASSTSTLSLLDCSKATDQSGTKQPVLAFASAMQHGQYGNGHGGHANHGDVTLLRPCSWYPELADLGISGQHNLDRCISFHLAKCTEADPLSLPQQALPNTTIRLMAITSLRRSHGVVVAVVVAVLLSLASWRIPRPLSHAARSLLTESDVKSWRGSSKFLAIPR